MGILSGTLIASLICFQFFYPSQASVHQCLMCDSNQAGCAEGSLQYMRTCPEGSDACFTSVTNGVLLRGCLSHLTEVEAHQNCTEKEGRSCLSCSENGCNTASWLRCAHCDDAGPEKCSDRQYVTFCPQYRSSDQCYEIVGSSEMKPSSKGCESTLELAGNACDQIEQCSVIGRNSNNCTVQTSLKTPVQCLVCVSEHDSNGECVEGTLPAENCPQEEDVCFSRLHGNTLERNCLSTLSPAEQDICTGEDSTCITCNDSGCNTDHLLKCIQCKKSDNIECIDLVVSSTLKATFCPNFLPNARCFSRILVDDLERGCSSESAGVCLGNNRCLSCDTDGCNVESETYLNNVAQCFRCTSNNGDNMACDEVYLGAEECDQLEDSCFIRLQGDILERNCLSNLAEDNQQKCRNEEDNSCYSCSDPGCNQYPRLRCYRCSSMLDPLCANPEENSLSYEFCDSFLPDDRCYARIVDQHVERGCEVDLNNIGEDVCAGDPMCFACHSSGCNSVEESTLKSKARCMSCSSERDGEECEKAAMGAEHCDDFNDICFTRVIDKNLQRGCLLTLEEHEQATCSDVSNTACITCESPSCNNQPWLKCLKCKKSENPDCIDPASTSLTEFASLCTKYDEQATCYVRTTEQDLERGCSVELANPGEVCTDTVACETCTTDNCNVQTESSLPSFSKCIQCTSEDENNDCNKQLPEATQCPEKNDKCFTQVFDGILSRNCLSVLTNDGRQKCTDPNDHSCIVCEEPGCNENHWTKCHQCDQSNSDGCEGEQSDNGAKLCKNYSADEECYTKLDQNHQLIRGCLSDVGTKDELCVDAKSCLTCKGDSCNTEPGSSLVHIKCQQCTSAEVGCLEGTIESRTCPLQDDMCYSTVNNDKLLERGCLSMLNEDMKEICKNDSNPACIVCLEDGCNEMQWPKCYRCNSSASDDSCDHKLMPDMMEFCPSYHDNALCYSTIEQGSVSRDCTNEKANICDGNSRCVACKDEGCNDLPKQELNTVHTCYRCRSDEEDCDHLKEHVQECGERNDRCYTRVDDELNLHRGCLSDIDADECDNSERCLICPDKNCNNAPWAKCFQCSNSTNEECASKQTTLDNLKYCQQYARHGECYVTIDPIEFRRGCTSDLEDVSCVESDSCVKCKGDGCNRDSLKSYFDPTYCLQCHSDMHIGCIDGSAPSMACENPDDACFYRRASSKAIHRGCLSELTSIDQRKCRSSTSLACHVCDENACNRAKWRRCHKCSSLVDVSCPDRQNSTFLEFCLKIDDDCFESNNHGEIYRGCGRHYCADKKVCVECAADACNGHPDSALQPSYCLVCNSTDPFCVNGTSMSQHCDYLNEPCYTLVRYDGILERGCFSKVPQDFKGICMDPTDRSCITCTSDSCNRDQWRQCVQCRSLELDQYCSRGTSLLKSHFCPLFQRNERCYAKDVEGTVIRGCLSDNVTQQDPCEGLKEKDCYTCNSDHCNAKTLNGGGHDRFYCHTCDSSSYRDCVWNPYTSLTKDCEVGDRACATVILPNGHTYRGCSQDAQCIAAGKECILCDSFSGCNIDRYPSDRLRCNICQSSQSNSCKLLPYPGQFEKPCIRLVAGDRCATVFDGFNVSYRDCLSSVREEHLSKCSESESSVECDICSRWNCNTGTVRQDDRCLQCTSNMTHCSSGMRTATVCSTPSEGKCYSRVDEDGFLVRGCLSDITDLELKDSCEKDGVDCVICDGSGCNARFLPKNTLTCVQCDSRLQLNCAQEQKDDDNVKYCRRHVQDDRCYTRTDTDGSLQRGCLSDLSNDTVCNAGSSLSCDVCVGSSCNKLAYPSNRLSCYQCNSEYALNCDAEQRNEELLKCRYHRNKDGCYIRTYQEDVIRGCISDLADGMDPCEGWNRKDCRTCYEDGCNFISKTVLRNSSSIVGTEMWIALYCLFHYSFTIFG
uniref:DUF753 domain-containing protein n=1 Tax=Anopheles minimus TaxID=112268 RepID=A0A182W9K8_9DIPT